MITRLHLENFKNFKNADLQLGPFSILVGKNATGKSNIRDAFRFLHGIGRGYSLAEIFGGKYEAGARVWDGIRGGAGGVTYQANSTFKLEVTFDIGVILPIYYKIEVKTDYGDGIPRVVKESLSFGEHSNQFQTDPSSNQDQTIKVQLAPGGDYKKGHLEDFNSERPILTQILNAHRLVRRSDSKAKAIKLYASGVIASLNSIRFLDLSSDALRIPSFPGQIILGDRGENLSSVLQDICKNKERKDGIVFWLKELTPLDVIDLEFVSDPQGKIIVSLVEEDGRKTLAYSASDGTLRFLGLIAALFSSNPNEIYFLEELENGIHPTRQYLLLDLIQRRTSQQKFQVIATTHSSQLLNFVEGQTLENASYLYRLKGTPDGHIKQIKDFDHIQDVLENQTLGGLLESGWFENMVAFDQDNEDETKDDEIKDVENEKVAVAR